MSDLLKSIGAPGLNGLDSGGQALSDARIASIKARAEKLEQKTGAATAGKEVSPKEQAEAEKVATQFEALLVQQMVKSMWSTVPDDGMLSGSREEELYRDFLNQEVADQLSEHQSIGIKDIIMKEFQTKGRISNP